MLKEHNRNIELNSKRSEATWSGVKEISKVHYWDYPNGDRFLDIDFGDRTLQISRYETGVEVNMTIKNGNQYEHLTF